METKFNSQICTSIEQSQRLIALGLKKETADMRWERISEKYAYYPSTKTHYASSDIPAWSLHRLMFLAEMKGSAFLDLDTAYETTISIIAAKIRFGDFNKAYLEESEEAVYEVGDMVRIVQCPMYPDYVGSIGRVVSYFISNKQRIYKISRNGKLLRDYALGCDLRKVED